MQIESLTLHRYRRFKLNQIEHFELTATSPIQVIIGTNGSGKSSVMSEWSLLPAIAADFKKGGYKIAIGSHNGSTYRVESHFNGTARHSFYKDDVALVDMGTATAVYDACRQELGLTKDVLDLIQGKIKFTSLSPMRRKDWLMRLSNIDLGFLTEFHERAKVAMRDTVGTIKHVGKRLADETAKLNALVVETDADTITANICTELDALMLAKTSDDVNLTDAHKHINHLLEEINDVVGRAEVALVGFDLCDEISNIDDIKHYALEQQATAKSLQSSMAALSSEIAANYETIESLKSVGSASLNEINANIEHLEAEGLQTAEKIAVFKNIPNVSDALDTLVGHQAFIIDAVRELIPFKNKFDPDAVPRLQEELGQTNDSIRKAENKIEFLNIRIQNLKDIHAVTCPNCEHEFKPGVGQHDDIGKLIEQVNNCQANISRLLAPRKKEIEEQINYFVERDGCLARVKTMVSDLPQLKPLWDVLIERELFYNSADKIESALSMFITDAELHLAMGRIKATINDAMLKKATLEHLDNADMSALENRNYVLELQYSDMVAQYTEANAEFTTYRNMYKRCSELYAISETLLGKLNQITELSKHTVTAIRNEALDGVIRQHQSTLGTLNNQIQTRNTLQGIVQFLETQFSDLQLQQRALKTLIEATSASNGLIAEQLMGFINFFTGQLNEVIEEFWNYDIKIKSCNNVDGELDYYFPFTVDNDPEHVDDIAYGSEAQVDLFNFVFRVIAAEYLGLTNYPLYADELGRTFDEQHRSNLITYIKRLMDAKQFSQLLMISHYAATHTAMQGSEICVIDSQNIMVQSHYNKHVIMK